MSIRPAMTLEEWANPTAEDACGGYVDMDIGIIDVRIDEPKQAHALAALCLHNQPFGFTWEDVDLLREAADELNAGAVWLEKGRPAVPPDGTALPGAPLASLADHIEALLPPREKP